MSTNTPTPQAYRFKITSGGGQPRVYELAIFANPVFPPEQIGFKTVYREETNLDWQYLTEPVIFKSQDFDMRSNEILKEITEKIVEFFFLNDSDETPESLFDRVEALVSLGIGWDKSKNSLRKK